MKKYFTLVLVFSFLGNESKLPLTKVEIYSLLGTKLKVVNSDFKTISTDNLLIGTYMIKIYSDKGTAVRKLIKY